MGLMGSRRGAPCLLAPLPVALLCPQWLFSPLPPLLNPPPHPHADNWGYLARKNGGLCPCDSACHIRSLLGFVYSLENCHPPPPTPAAGGELSSQHALLLVNETSIPSSSTHCPVAEWQQARKLFCLEEKRTESKQNVTFWGRDNTGAAGEGW